MGSFVGEGAVLTNGQRFVLLPPESMQRHQFCVAALSRIALRIHAQRSLARLSTLLHPGRLACGASERWSRGTKATSSPWSRAALRVHDKQHLARERGSARQRSVEHGK